MTYDYLFGIFKLFLNLATWSQSRSVKMFTFILLFTALYLICHQRANNQQRNGCNVIDHINAATLLCLSHTRTSLSIGITCGIFVLGYLRCEELFNLLILRESLTINIYLPGQLTTTIHWSLTFDVLLIFIFVILFIISSEANLCRFFYRFFIYVLSSEIMLSIKGSG